jgi:hypothetical protein
LTSPAPSSGSGFRHQGLQLASFAGPEPTTITFAPSGIPRPMLAVMPPPVAIDRLARTNALKSPSSARRLVDCAAAAAVDSRNRSAGDRVGLPVLGTARTSRTVSPSGRLCAGCPCRGAIAATQVYC